MRVEGYGGRDGDGDGWRVGGMVGVVRRVG